MRLLSRQFFDLFNLLRGDRFATELFDEFHVVDSFVVLGNHSLDVHQLI